MPIPISLLSTLIAWALVTIALLVVVTIVMFLAMTQFGLYLYGLGVVENAARNEARAGSVAQACPTCQAIQATRGSLQGAPVLADASFEILAPGGVVGSLVEIRVTANIPLIVPGSALFGLENVLSVSSEATFRQEGW
jgi:predicted ABC-type sugar transport system permease subunit